MVKQFLNRALLLLLLPVSSFAQTGTTLFQDNIIHEIRISSPNSSVYSDMETSHSNHLLQSGPNNYFKFEIEIDGTTLDDSVGVRMKGETSFTEVTTEKKPFKIDINKYEADQKYEGLKKFNLHNARSDASMIREKICYDLLREVGVKTPRVSFAKLYLNGTYWGLYSIVEQVDKRFLKDNFSNKDGNLYKSLSGGSINLTNMELKTNETANDFSKLQLLNDKITNTPDAQFEDTLKKYLNVPRYLASLATDVLVLDVDKYWQSGKNFYLYENTLTGKFEWIPWDYNLAMNYILDGSQNDPNYKEFVDNDLFDDKTLVKRIMDNANLRAEYMDILCQLKFVFNTTTLFDKINTIYALIETDALADTKKPYSNAEFQGNIATSDYNDFTLPNPVPGVKQFITDRSQALEAFLTANSLSCTSVIGLPESEGFTIKIYPNPAKNKINVQLNSTLASKIIITDLSGRTMHTEYTHMNLSSINLTGYPDGMYLLLVLDKNETPLATERFIKK